MLTVTILILAVIVNLTLWHLYRRAAGNDLEAAEAKLEAVAIANRNLHDYCDSLECENRRLIAYNAELQARLKRRQALNWPDGLRMNIWYN